MVLHKLLRNISEEQGLEGWVAAKITLANDYLKSVREHLEYQMMSSDVDEDDFLPLAESTKYNKKKINEELSNTELQKFERGPWYIIISGQAVPDKDGTPKKFNWLNAAKMHFRSMLDDDPKVAAQLKSEYDKATDKKSVIYYSKKLPVSNTNTQSDTTDEKVSETSNKPGLWANIRAKRERIKSGSGERMRAPGSKGAPSDKDLKSIRAASESTENANSTWYDNLTGKYPKTKLALDLLPPTAMATSAVDAVNNLSKGNYGAAAIDAAGLIPGVKPLSKFLPKLLSIDNISRGRKVGKGTSTVKDVGDYIDSEFPHKVNESDFHSQFAAMIDDMKKSGKLKTGDSTKSNRNFKTPEPKSKEELMSRLKELEAEFDPAYQQSDDYSFWKKQNDIASEISSIKRQLQQQDVAEGSLNEFASDDSGDDGYYKEYMRGYKDGKGYPEVVKSSKNREIWMTVTPKKPPLTEPYMRGWYDGKYGPSPGKDLINLDKLREQGLAEGLAKDIKRLATGKDVKSRAGQEIAKSQDASMKGDTKTSKKHFDRYDKLDKLANKEQGVAKGLDPETTRLEQDVRSALENGDDYTAKQYAKMAPTPEAKKYLLNIIKQEMYGTDPEQGVAEGKWSHNANTGQKLDPRTGEPLPSKEKPLTMKQMFAPKTQPKLTLDDVWRKVENVVSKIYPDGDPIDYMAPWLEKHGIKDFKIGEVLDRAAKKNGYKDMYDYWDSMGEQGVAEGQEDLEEATSMKQQWKNDVKQVHGNNVRFEVEKAVRSNEETQSAAYDEKGNKVAYFYHKSGRQNILPKPKVNEDLSKTDIKKQGVAASKDKSDKKS